MKDYYPRAGAERNARRIHVDFQYAMQVCWLECLAKLRSVGKEAVATQEAPRLKNCKG